MRAVQDVIDETSQSDEEAFVLALDFRKAFDTVRRTTINKALEWFNIGDSFRDSEKKPSSLELKHASLMGVYI